MSSSPSLALLLFYSITLSACAQAPAPSPPPERPLAGRPSPMGQHGVLEQHLGAMRDIQQKMLQAGSAAERQALAPAHSRAMRDALAAMQAPHGMAGGMARGAGMPIHGQAMGQRHAMMQMLMEMLVLRIDLLSGVPR